MAPDRAAPRRYKKTAMGCAGSLAGNQGGGGAWGVGRVPDPEAEWNWEGGQGGSGIFWVDVSGHSLVNLDLRWFDFDSLPYFSLFTPLRSKVRPHRHETVAQQKRRKPSPKQLRNRKIIQNLVPRPPDKTHGKETRLKTENRRPTGVFFSFFSCRFRAGACTN